MSRPTRLLLRFSAITAFGVLALAVLGLAFFPEIGKLKEAASFQPLSKLTLPELPESSKITSEGGDPMGELTGSENRVVVELDQISPELRDTVLATEDASFYEHSGVSARSVFRALRANTEAGEISQGGSTITQQLVKLSLVGSETSLSRKLKEASLALQLEDQLCDGVPKRECKDRIFEQYLNTVYLGRGAYGMEAASQTYFNKPASEITYAEAPILAMLIRNPNGYDPIEFPELADEQRDLVIDRMVDEDVVTEAEAELLSDAPMPTQSFERRRSASSGDLTYLERRIRDELLAAEWLAPTEELRRYLIFNGGLRITTTVDPEAQLYAEAAAASNPLKSANPETAVGLAAVEPSSGAVRAIVGEVDVPGEGLVEIGSPKPGRSSGSSFKPFTLVAALDSGYSINSTISGAPAPENMKKLWGVTTKGQYPEDCPTKGTVDFATALSQSNNCAFMRMQAAIGYDKVKETAIKLGVSPDGLDPSDVEPPCFTIGCDALVGPLDMATAYATIANDGRRNPAHFVTRVEDRKGNVLFDYVPVNEQVVSPDVARQAIIAMRKVVTSGTYSGGSLPQSRPAAGKTGTTELEGGKNTDVWFVGFTPQISTAVWIGNPTANTNMTGGRVQGGATAARVWRSFMAPFSDGTPVVDFADPDSVPRARSVSDPWSKSGSSSSSSSSSSRRSGSSSSSGSGSSGTRSTSPPTTASSSGGTTDGATTEGTTGGGTGGGTGGTPSSVPAGDGP